MPSPAADYLFLAALLLPVAGILLGVTFLFLPTQSRIPARTKATEAKAHG